MVEALNLVICSIPKSKLILGIENTSLYFINT
jgi:hypothetical protein